MTEKYTIGDALRDGRITLEEVQKASRERFFKASEKLMNNPNSPLFLKEQEPKNLDLPHQPALES